MKDQWNVTEDTSEHNRRSIYIFARRNLRFPMFEAFDRPAANESCSRRNVSTTAPQALHLLNSEFSLRIAELIAGRIHKRASDVEKQITEAFQLMLSRSPTASELADSQRFLADTEGDALTYLCLSLLNCNEFVFVD